MPGRIALGVTEWWEPVVAAAVACAALAFLVTLAGRLYTGAALHTGPTLKLREAWQRTTASHRSESNPEPGGHASPSSARRLVGPPGKLVALSDPSPPWGCRPAGHREVVTDETRSSRTSATPGSNGPAPKVTKGPTGGGRSGGCCDQEVTHMKLFKHEHKSDLAPDPVGPEEQPATPEPVQVATEPTVAPTFGRMTEHHDDGDLVLTAEMAGLDPNNDVELTVSDGVLRIEAQHREAETTEDDGYVCRELRYRASCGRCRSRLVSARLTSRPATRTGSSRYGSPPRQGHRRRRAVPHGGEPLWRHRDARPPDPGERALAWFVAAIPAARSDLAEGR